MPPLSTPPHAVVDYFEASCDRIDLEAKVAYCTSKNAYKNGRRPQFEVPYDILVVRSPWGTIRDSFWSVLLPAGQRQVVEACRASQAQLLAPALPHAPQPHPHAAAPAASAARRCRWGRSPPPLARRAWRRTAFS